MSQGEKVYKRNSSGGILTKFADNWLVNNIATIISLTLSGFYVVNTLASKKIDKDRKPTLCVNMGFVAAFSAVTGKALDVIMVKSRDVLSKAHADVMKQSKKSMTFDSRAAWKQAMTLVVTTITFRYLGPVIAAPVAEQLTKWLQANGIMKKPTEHKK